MSDSQHAGGPLHSAQSSVSQVDSTASTLLASPSSSQSYSFDKHRAYNDLAFDKNHTRHRDHDDPGDEDTGIQDQENDHLLAHDVDSLSSQPQDAAATLPDDEPAIPPVKEKARQVKWRELPKKGQLAILTLARLSEPLTQQGLQSYMFYQLKSFTDSKGAAPSDSTVASQAGLLAAAFTGAQFLTAFMWGRLADSEAFGRKKVILIGLLGTAIGSLGFGFSKSFAAAVFWRCFGGMLNG